jgi:hypothetical protein
VPYIDDADTTHGIPAANNGLHFPVNPDPENPGFSPTDSRVPGANGDSQESYRTLEGRQVAVDEGPTGWTREITTIDRQGSSVTEDYDSLGNLTSARGINASGATWSETASPDGNQWFAYNGQTFSGSQLLSGTGLTLGSTIGGILGGNSLAGRIVGATVLGTLGQSVGDALVRSGLGSALVGNGTLTSSLLDNALSTTIADFGGNLAPNAIGNIAGSFSSLLFGEAAQALHLTGFAGGLFTTVGTTITSQLATNLGAMTLNSVLGTALTANFSPDAFIGNIGGAIGGYFGSYLAAEIVPATGIASSIGGRIGGAIGSFLGSEIPVVGTFLGSLAGSVLGTLVGSLFDPHVVPSSMEMVGAVNGVLGINYWNFNSTGNPQEFTSLSNLVAGQANQVLALTRRDPNIMDITGLSGLNELIFTQNGSTLTAIYPDGNRTDFYVAGMPQAFALQALFNTSEIATYELVQHANLAGADPIITGALAAARVQDTTTPAVYADLLIAQDYERYRANAEIINTAMAANPASNFTAGWNLTLLRAQALGLDRIMSQPGFTASLVDGDENIRDAAGNVVQQLVFNADGTVSNNSARPIFNFNFVDARLTYGTNGHTYLTGPDGVAHDVSAAQHLYFNDGHIDEADGTPLVDDLYYDSQYHDVYLSGLDPDQHYALYGWHDGRNPNAYFDTNYYLSHNPDVAALGIFSNPLSHYDSTGWREGRNPSARFSTNGYLSAYPDVAAAGTDPLAQFLQYGMAEGRMSRGTDLIHGDFNGDGLGDSLWRNSATGEDLIAFANASGGFTLQWLMTIPPDWNWNTQGIGDFNGDGRTDILWRATNGDVSIWYVGNTPGSFTPHEIGIIANDWTIQGTGDFNGDNRDDILWRNSISGDVGVWYMNSTPGSYSWQDLMTIPPGGNWNIQGTGDFDGDGRSDILWRNTNGDTSIWYTGSTQGSFSSLDLGTVTTDWSLQPSGDFNGDGRSDLLWRNANGDTGIWYMSSSGGHSWQDLGVVGLDWTITEAADFNGDGRSDIFWRNASGAGSIWTAQANGTFTGRDVGTADPAWRMVA